MTKSPHGKLAGARWALSQSIQRTAPNPPVDPKLMACGLMVHALRSDRDSAVLLLESLPDDQVRDVALMALEGLATAARTAGGTHHAEQIALGIQDGIYDIEGN